VTAEHGRLLDSFSGQSGGVHAPDLSLDAGDYDAASERVKSAAADDLRTAVPKALLASLPEGSRTFGYIVDDHGQLLVRSSEPRRL
jgi:hypothetical protein